MFSTNSSFFRIIVYQFNRYRLAPLRKNQGKFFLSESDKENAFTFTPL